MSDCIDENSALQYVEGLLDETAARAIDEHVAGCDDCRWMLAEAGAAALDEMPSVAPTQHYPNAKAEPESWASTDPADDPRLSRTLRGTYIIRRFIGRGGMGTVYAADHLRLERRFAIKFIAEAFSSNPEAITRLQREAQVTSRLAHPHIIEVIDFNHGDDGAPFIVMELLEGEPLGHRLRRDGGMRDFGEIATIVGQAASALHAAHGRGIVHRDLKPTNIFLCKRETPGPFVKVMDFGISKVMGLQSGLTGDASLMGSPRYMAPEQARGRATEVDQRADIFALGVVIFEMLTGELPFQGDSVPDTLFKVVYERPAIPRRWRELPSAVQRVVLRALSKDPAQRQQSMAQLWREFSAALRTVGLTDTLDEPLALTEHPRAPAIVQSLTSLHRRLALRVNPIVLSAIILLLAAATIALVTLQLPSPEARARQLAESRASVSPPAHASAEAAREPPRQSAPASQVETRRSAPATSGHVANERRERRPRRRRHATRTRSARQAQTQRKRSVGSITVQSKAEGDGRYLWATVYVDGKRVGMTALTLEKIPTGRHVVEARRKGYRTRSQSIRVTQGKQTRVLFELEPTQGSSIAPTVKPPSSDPAGASVPAKVPRASP